MTEPEPAGAEPSYAAASAELARILQELESGQIDLDVLAEKVERAAALLAFCRERLATTATRVRKITSEMDDTHSDDDASPDGAKP